MEDAPPEPRASHTAPSPCVRCGHDTVDEFGCVRCGYVVDDERGDVRAARFLQFTLTTIAADKDPLARLSALTAPLARTTPAEPAKPADNVDDDSAVTAAAARTEAPAASTPTPAPAAVRATRPPSPSPPLPDPQAARQALERRLEFGGWFVGALFAVGGSLWATNLFWGDIPAALRPAVVGGGLAVFAAAFLAVGAFLGQRHPGTSAGAVLSVVGRLIGVAAALPLGYLWRDVGAVALVVDVGIAGLLYAALRFAGRARTGRSGPALPDTDTAHDTARDTAGDTARDAALYAGGFVLAALAPAGPWGMFVVDAAAVALARVARAARTDRALAGARSVWVDDVSALALAAMALASDVAGGTNATALVCAVWAFFVDTLVRQGEERPVLFGMRGGLRWVGAAAVTVFALVAFVDAAKHSLDVAAQVGALVASAFAAAAAFSPARLSLPSFSRLGFFVWVSAAGTASGSLVSRVCFALCGEVPSLSADVWRISCALVALALATPRQRRTAPLPPGERVASALWLCVLTAFAVGVGADDGPSALPLALAAFVWASDRRATRAVLWALVAWTCGATGVAFLGVRLFGWSGETAGLAAVVAAAVAVHALITSHRRAPARPLSSMLAAGVVFLAGAAGVGLTAVTLASDAHTSIDLVVLVVLVAVALVAIVAAAERTRNVDAAVIGLVGFVVSCAVVLPLPALVPGDVDVLAAAAAGVVGVAVLAWLPALPAPLAFSGRLLTPALTVLSRARRARPFAACVVASVGVVVVDVVVVCANVAAPRTTHTGATVLAALAAVLLVLRCPARRVLPLALMAIAVAAANVGAHVAGALPFVSVVSFAVFFAVALMVACAAAAIVVAVLRVRGVTLPRITRGQRRRGARVQAHTVAADVLLAVGSVLAGALLVVIVAQANDAATAFAATAAWAAATAAWAAAQFLSTPHPHARQALTWAAVWTATAAPASALAWNLVHGREGAALGCALAVDVVLALALLGARACYRPRGATPPSIAVAWPAPSTLRFASQTLLVPWAAALSLVALGFRLSGSVELARSYGPGVVVVAVATAVVGVFVAWRTARTTSAVLVAFVTVAAAGAAVNWTGHAAGVLAPSHGAGEAAAAAALVAASLLFVRAWGRRWLCAVGLALPRAVRTRVGPIVVVASAGLALYAVVLACFGLGQGALFAPELLFGALALGGLGFAHPQERLAPLTAIGAIFAAVAVAAGASGAVVDVDHAPLLLAAAMAAALAVQTGSARVWRVPALRRLHPTLRDDDAAACARAARTTAEAVAFAVLALLVWVSLATSTTTTTALAATWIAMGLSVVLFSSVAVVHQQTPIAALAQGIALAIYVDLRRRTPWLDDVDGIDALVLVAAAGVFFALRSVARRRDGGGVVARAAEVYAVTLPLLATTLAPHAGGRALVLVVGGALYAALARSKKSAAYEFLCGGAVLAACLFGLASQGVSAPEAYLFPVAVVGTFLGRRHRRALGSLGRSLAVLSHVPLYTSVAWSALRSGTFGSFAVAVVVAAVGVVYAIRAKDRRALYAGCAAAAVLVVGRLVIAGLDNAVLGTLLLVGLGIALLAGMTVFTIRRDAARAAWVKASRLGGWDDDPDDNADPDGNADPDDNADHNADSP